MEETRKKEFDELKKLIGDWLDKTVQKEETFIAKVAKGGRVTVYEPVRELLGIEDGDFVRVTVQIERKVSSAVSPPVKPEPPVEEPIVEPIIEPVVKAEPEKEVMEIPLVQETTVTQRDPIKVTVEPELDEAKPEPESEEPPKAPPVIPAKLKTRLFFKPESEEEKEYVDPCPSGLDYPLQDTEMCREWKCTYYKRRWGERAEACTWSWLKIGWEEDVEKEAREETES